jgi:hypothetical protein
MVLRRVAPLLVVTLASLLALLSGSFGCASSSRKKTAPPPPVVVNKPAQLAQPIADTLTAGAIKTNGPVSPPQNILVISGGGQYAAYNAGAIVGWTEIGNRPKFDVVTGISSGAIVAMYAFLGERYDSNLTRFFTTTRQKDLFVYRPALELIRNGSLASNKRLADILEKEINECFLLDLREAHKEGRRLYVGSMSVRTKRLTIWDLGAVACSERPDADRLVRKILLAAIAYPGLLPAVEFDEEVDGVKYTEQHVDGGAVSQAFLRVGPQGERPSPTATGWLQGSNLYAMAAGKLYAPEITGEPGILKRVGGSVSAALYALYRAEVTMMYSFCGVSGMTFHLNAIPEDAQVPPNSMKFDTEAMRRLFSIGRNAAKNGIPWRFTPPGTEPGEEAHPVGVERLAPPHK